MTFTFDERTVRCLKQAAERLARTQSWVVREAVSEYAARVGKLSDSERRQRLDTLDALMPLLPRRAAAAVAGEIRAIRTARRKGARRSGNETR